MKTEMKKNNKAFLALVVVAALAAVSFAGIALSDDSDAVLISNNIVIQPGETDTKDYSFYVLKEDEFFQAFEFVVSPTGSYTGTISLGTASDDMSTYTPYSSLKLTNASAVRITGIMYNSPETGEIVTVFMIGNFNKEVGGALPAGTYELTKGQAILGAPFGVTKAEWQAFGDLMTIYAFDVTNVLNAMLAGLTYMVSSEKITAFNGTLSAGDLSVTSSYTVGTMVSLTEAGDARLSSFYMAASPDEALPNDPLKTTGSPLFFPDWEDRTLSISGTASVQYPEVVQRVLDRSIGDVLAAWPGIMSNPTYGPLFSDNFRVDAVNVTIEEGSVITIGDRASTLAQDIVIDAGSNISLAYLIDGSGKVYSATGTGTTTVNFGYVPLGVYTLIMTIQPTTGDLEYYGTATVSGSGLNYSLSIGANQLSSLPGAVMLNADLGISAAGTLEYDDNDYYELVFAFCVDNEEVGKLAKDSNGVLIEGSVIFDTSLIGGEEVFFVAKSAAGVRVISFYTGMVGTNNGTGAVRVENNTMPLDDNEIRAGAVSIDSAVATFASLDASKFLIKGEVNVLYNTATNYGVMDLALGDAYLDFEGTGIIAYEVVPMTIPIEPSGILGGLNGATRINAAYFYKNVPATGTPTKSTYYFTTLTNALTMSNEITLNGRHVILEDTTFANPDFPTMTIILGPGAILEVGKILDAYGDDYVDAILTIPAGTTVRVPGSADHYGVINGQAVYDVRPSPLTWEPDADVLIIRTSPAKFIYTDVGTALDISVSGDVINLRQDAYLFRNANLKDGVTLNDTPLGDLIITNEATLTVDGTLNSKYNMEIYGTLRINKIANFTNNATASLFGTILVTSTGELIVKDTASISSGSPTELGWVEIAGKITLSNTAMVSVGTIVLTGTATIASTAYLSASELLQIGAEPEISPLNGTYVNSAVINGKITLATAVAYVYGDFAISASTTGNIDLSPGATLERTEYKIADKLYVTLYVEGPLTSTSPLLPMIYGDKLVDVIIKDWNNERLLRGDSLREELRETVPACQIGATNWTVVYADYELKKYTVTFFYLQGMTWVCNGLDQAGGAAIQVEYGKTVSVTGVVQPGYETTSGGLVLRLNGSAYTPGTAHKVIGDVTFTASGVQLATEKVNDGLTLIEILLIIIVIIIAVIALIVAVRLLRS